MRSLLLLVSLLTSLSAFAQFTTGAADTLHSKILNEDRAIWVHLPARFDPQKKYPVVYLLDAENNFTTVVGMIGYLSEVYDNRFLPELIVVGIPNTDRRRDLTPTKVTSGLWIDDDMARHSGGGEAFTAFLEKELIPHIDSLYPTTLCRVLIGHSLGGLLVINTVVHHPGLFRDFIAIDPSMWWDQQRLLHESNQKNIGGSALFLAMAHTQPPGLDTTTLQQDTTTGTLHPRSILQLSRYISGPDAVFKYYDAETHASVPLMATYDALRFIFKDYPLQFQDAYFTDSTFQLAAFLKKHFQVVSAKYGLNALPPEAMVDGLGRFVLRKNAFRKAGDMFLMNASNYPQSPVVYDALGDLYAAEGDKAKAAVQYKKSLKLKETPDTRKKLSALQ